VQPLSEKPRCRHGTFSAERDGHPWKALPPQQGEQLRQGLSGGAKLHPPFERRLRAVATAWLVPTGASDGETRERSPGARRKSPPPVGPTSRSRSPESSVGANRSNRTRMFRTTPRRLEAPQESRMAMRERTRTRCTSPHHIRFISCAGKVSSITIDPLAVSALAFLAFRLGSGRKQQDRISPHLPDDADLLFDQGRNQTAPHEPGIDQQAHTPLTCPRTEFINSRSPQSLPRCPESSSSRERIGTVSTEPSRMRTTTASVTQHWLLEWPRWHA